jgi:plastocyanin
MGRRRKAVAAVAVGAILFAACGREGASKQAVEDTVRASITAENAKDAKTFVTYWTDKGLKSYDVGSRADLLAGKNKDFGSEPFRLVRIADEAVTAEKASITLDATPRGTKFVNPLYRVKFTLIKSGDNWLIDGFEFLGSPPPASGATILGVKAHEYAFDLDATQVPGNFAIRFSNTGKQQHEMTFFKAPGPIDVGTAKTALQNINGQTLEPLPAGYQVDHLSFLEPGKSADVTFVRPLTPGTYVFACYIPEGGFGPNGPVNPNGKPHIQLGMVNVLTVT